MTEHRMRARRVPPPPRRQQRGVVAIIVGLSIAAMVGFAGLAIDAGRLYVTKTELQNAADACALAASFELNGAPTIPPANFALAENAGLLVAERNRVGFQGAQIDRADVTVEFSNLLSGGAWLTAGANPPGDARYVRCTIPEAGIAPMFMQVLGAGPSTVRAAATASLVPSQQVCNGIPLAMCAPSPGGSRPLWTGRRPVVQRRLQQRRPVDRKLQLGGLLAACRRRKRDDRDCSRGPAPV